MEEECCEGGYRGDEENPTPENIFAKNYHALDINMEDLPEYKKKKIIYTKEKPAFLVAWLQDHLSALLNAKETFMPGFVGDIVPTKFNFDFENGKNQVNLRLEFTIDDE